MDGIRQVVINFSEDDEGEVQARITVLEDGVRASVIDQSDTDYFSFWGEHLSKVIAQLQGDIKDGAATGGDKDSQTSE